MNAPSLEPLPDYGDHMTIREWLSCVVHGSFIDYDGCAIWATETHCESRRAFDYSAEVLPSMVSQPGFAPPAWATHVVWFNR